MIPDFSKTYRVEAIPSKEHGELAKKGLGTFPGITQSVSASWNDTLRKFTHTGLDEHAPEILRLPVKEREEAQKAIIEKREYLESLIGFPGFLKPQTDNWLNPLCMVEIEVGQDLAIRVNGHTNVLNPMESYKDAIALCILMNNPNFPKSKADISDPTYKNSRFYITTDEEVTTISKGNMQKTRKAHVEMDKLFSEGKEKGKAWEVAFYLKLVNKQKVNLDTLEESIYNAVFKDLSGKTIDLFLEACQMSTEKLLLHNMFQQGINLGIIRVSPDNYYHRGHTNYKKTKQDSVEYLQSPGMEIELAELRSEIEKRKKKHNSIG